MLPINAEVSQVWTQRFQPETFRFRMREIVQRTLGFLVKVELVCHRSQVGDQFSERPPPVLLVDELNVDGSVFHFEERSHPVVGGEVGDERKYSVEEVTLDCCAFAFI